MLVIDLNERCQAKDIISDLNNMSNYDHQTTIKIEEDRETLDSEIVNGIIMNDMIDEENNRNELETFYQEEYKEDLKEDLIIKRISEENLEDLEQEYIYEEFQTTTHLKNKLNNEQQIGKFKFIDLSDEIIMIIIEFLIGNNNNNNNLKYLISFKNFYHLSISCKRLYEISNNDEIWKNILQNRLFLYRFFDTTRKYKIILEPSDKKEFIYLYKKQENYKKYKNYKKEYELNYDIVRFIGILSLMFLFSIIPTLLFGLLLDEIIIPTFINYMLVWLSSLPLIIIVIAILNNFKYFPLLTFIYLIYSKYLNFRKKIKEKKLKILKENPNLVTMKDFIFETNYIKLTLKGYLYFNNNIFYNLIYSPFITCILFFIFIGFIFINFYENFSLTYFLAIPLIIYLTYFNINTFILSKNIEDKSLYRFIIFFLLTIPTILFITQLLITCLMMDHKIWLNNRVWSLSFIPIYIFIMYPFILIIITCVAAKKNYLFRFSGDSLDYFGMTLIVYIIFFSIPLTVMFILIGLKLDNILPSTILFSYLFIIPTAILFICGFILAFIAFLFKRDEYFTGKMFRGLNKHFKEFSIYSNNNNNNSNSHSLFVHTKTLPIHIPLVRNDDDDDNDVLIREFWRFNY